MLKIFPSAKMIKISSHHSHLNVQQCQSLVSGSFTQVSKDKRYVQSNTRIFQHIISTFPKYHSVIIIYIKLFKSISHYKHFTSIHIFTVTWVRDQVTYTKLYKDIKSKAKFSCRYTQSRLYSYNTLLFNPYRSISFYMPLTPTSKEGNFQFIQPDR